MTPAEYLEARYAEEQSAAEALRSEAWGHLPWAVTECSYIGEDGASREGCPCIVYQGEYKPFDEAQVPLIQYIADGEAPEYAAHIATWDPARILAEVMMKRELLALAAARCPGSCLDHSAAEHATDEALSQVMIRALLRPYRSRPDFDPEWA